MDLSGLGRILLVVALVIAVIGVVMILAGRGLIPRLPGDIAIERKNFRFYFPLGTSIVVSVVLTLLLNLFLRR
jgi:predicted membrane channel-forming protein YqfA (hemolysin III family)